MAVVRAGDEISVALNRELSKFCEEENEAMKRAVHKTILETKRELKNSSPKRGVGGGDYASGWTARTKVRKYDIEGVIYNKNKPGLTHLLENGHVIRNKKGTYGRTNAHPHIGPASEHAEERLIELLVEDL